MRGSVREKRPGSWELRIYSGTDAATGKRCYRTTTVRGTRAVAESALRELVDSVTDRSKLAKERTVADLLHRWFDTSRLDWSPATVRQTRSVMSSQLGPLLGDVRLGELTTERIDAAYQHLREHGGATGRPLTAGTVKRAHVVLHSALSQAVRWGWLWDNPSDHARRIVAMRSERRPPTAVELVVAHIAGVDADFHAFVVLAATTGARRAQLLALRWRDVDLEHSKVAFRAGLVEGEHGPEFTVPKTKRPTCVDLDARTVGLLRAYQHRRPRAASEPECLAFSLDGAAETVWKPNWVTKRFRAYQHACGVGPYRLHDLRHFMATQMLDLDVPVTVVSRRLGHQRVSTTLDHYSHVISGRDRQAAERLAGILAPPTVIGGQHCDMPGVAD